MNDKYLKSIIILVISIGLVSASVSAGFSLVKQNKEINIDLSDVKDSEFYIVSYKEYTPRDLQSILNYNFDLISFEDDVITIELIGKEVKFLESQNISPSGFYKDYLEYTKEIYDPDEMRAFRTYTSMTSELQQISNDYSSIVYLESLGQSVQSREIWALKISDNPTMEEVEPEVRICGCHHGNEYMSVELPMELAWYLVQNYGTDPYVTDLVDNTEIWLIPMVNPDGRTAGSRYNSNGVDLNRDYGYNWNGEGGSPSPFSQPETQIIRNHALENNFVISLSYHTTAAYINYIWNYKPQPTPEEPLIAQWADEYHDLNPLLQPIAGYDWYQTHGDTNDFSYGCRGDIDTTIETANSNIPGVWNQNRDAMLMTIEWAGYGLHGEMTDADTGEPIYGSIYIEEQYWPIFTDPYLGDYHKPLLPGTYNVHFTANGYIEQIHQIEITDLETPVYFDVEMQPGGGKYAFEVTSCEIEGPYTYSNNPTDGIHALGAPDQYFSSLGVGGNLVLDMSNNAQINDGPGDDFIVYEGDDGQTESYEIYVSKNWKGPWTLVGTGTGTASFDLFGTGLSFANFVKIVDDGDGNPSSQYPGIDIDAVESGSFQYDNDVGPVDIYSPEENAIKGAITVQANIENFGLEDQTDFPVNCNVYSGGNVLYEEHFEDENGLFTVSGGLWQWGQPVVGPSTTHSGINCWGTNLYGDYYDNSNARLTSPSISLPTDTPAELSFWHWFDIECGSSVWDGGNVKISTNGGSSWQVLGDYLDPYPYESASSSNQGIPGESCFSDTQNYWSQVTIDLSDYAGEDIMLRWHFGSDSSVHYDGWYLDDIKIETQFSSTPIYSSTEFISVNAGMVESLSFTPQWIAEPGTYLIEVITYLEGDQKAINNEITKIVNIEDTDDFILNLIDFPMYIASGGDSNYAGPAVAKMTLDYLWWDQSQDPTPPEEFYQADLYIEGLSYNADPELDVFDLQGMHQVIQNNRPGTYQECGYNFLARQNTDLDYMLGQICKWMAYDVDEDGTVGFLEGHPHHVPSVIPSQGNYDNWIVVRGIHTDVEPYPLPDELVVNGFWLNDPDPAAFQENYYASVSDFVSNYYDPMTTGDAWDGKYVAILEPPEEDPDVEVIYAQPRPQFNSLQARFAKLAFANKGLRQYAIPLIKQAAVNGVTEELVPYDADFAELFETMIPQEPVFVKNSRGDDFFAVPFSASPRYPSPDIQVIVLVKASDGSFMEVSWTDEPSVFLEVSRQGAVDIATSVLEELGEVVTGLEPSLIYRNNSPFYPEWMVVSENYQIYISQDGSFEYIHIK